MGMFSSITVERNLSFREIQKVYDGLVVMLCYIKQISIKNH